MDTIVSERYFRVTRLYLNIIGVWPYQSKYRQYFLRTIVYTIMVSSILAQVSHVVCFFDMETLTNNIFTISTCAIALMKHFMCCAKSSQFKVLLEGIVNDLKTDSTKEELAVMMPYIKRSIYMATAYLYAAMSIAVIFIQMPLLPLIADIILPLNTTRPRKLIVELHYFFVDQDKHYFWKIFHTNMSVLITATTSIGCDTLYIYTVLHACGLFEVAGYVREIDEFFCGILFIVVGITVLGFSSSLYWLSKLKPSEEFYVHLTSLLTALLHILFLTFMGHYILTKTDAMYNKIYEGQWYNSVPKTQALFILALRTAMNPPQITAGGIIALNLQTFAQIVKLSFSYFTVLQSA